MDLVKFNTSKMAWEKEYIPFHIAGLLKIYFSTLKMACERERIQCKIAGVHKVELNTTSMAWEGIHQVLHYRSLQKYSLRYIPS